MKKSNVLKLSAASLVAISLMGCAPMNNNVRVKYQPDSYVSVDRIAAYRAEKAKEKAQLDAAIQEIRPSQTAVLSSYGFSQNPKVIAAYNNYEAGKSDVVVTSPGFVTYPYDAYSHPVITCAPLRVCTIQLEKGEHINSIQMGDTARWLVTTFLTGPNEADGSESVAFKPKVATSGIKTDLIIATDRRTYTLGLLSDPNSQTHIVNFYYPEDTLKKINEAAMSRILKNNNSESVSSSQSSGFSTKGTVVNTEDIHTNYIITGDKPAWEKGMQVYDDGIKTFIRMPKITDRMSLPVVWVLTSSGDKEPTNANYQHPYFILNGLYQDIYLKSGVGKNKVEVTIHNQNITTS